MTVVEAVRARLLSLTPVTSRVSTRIYPVVIPQSNNLWPAIKLQQIGKVEFMHLRGSSKVFRARIQVDYVVDVDTADDWYADAHAGSDAAHGDGQFESATGLCGWRGDIGSPAFRITGIIPEAAGPREVREDDGDQRRFRVHRDYLTWFIE